MSLGAVTPAAIGAVLANAVAVAVAFGAPLSPDQQHVLLIFAGSVTLLVFAVVASVHAHTTSQAVKLASSSAATASAPAAPGGGGGIIQAAKS